MNWPRQIIQSHLRNYMYMISHFQMHHDKVCFNINFGNKILESQWRNGKFKKNKKDKIVPVSKAMDYSILIQDREVKKKKSF